MKQISSPGGHSHVEVRRVRDSLHGDMIAVKVAHPEVQKEQETWLSPAGAKQLAENIQDALLWMKEPATKPST